MKDKWTKQDLYFMLVIAMLLGALIFSAATIAATKG